MVALSSNNDASTAQPDQPSTRSFFSRFALPIRSRNTRNLVDFHIRPAEPHRKFNAGDSVRGAVHLSVVKPIRVTHLTVALRGFVRVYKGPNTANEPLTVDSASEGASQPQFRFLGNGLASLFRDEQVLCADGRLEAGKYQFNFELVFPEDGLPSSIEFERGTISYTITATLTRPTAINATTSCERTVELVEQIDVGVLPLPRARTIYLEPISKRSKKKRAPGSILSDKPSDRQINSSENAGDNTSDLDSTRVIETSTDGSQATDDTGQDSQQNPRSPGFKDVRSEVSAESAVSGSSSSRNADSNQVGSTGTTQTVGSKKSPGKRTIVTSIELLKGGCLPGDTVSVKVNVQHTKPIRSMHGVIVTLYRQGRVDSAPPASLFKNLSEEERRRLEKEEYYPKSKTGLGGLSLSSAGSCSVFRKDLSQAFSPLIVDPVDFTACVTTSVRVPEDAFPSIRGVPGEMISFKYRLEVIVDLGGKLSNAIQIGQNTRVAAGGGAMPSTRDMAAGVIAFDGNLINTDALKREKGVIFDSFEIIVGTTNSAKRGKAVAYTNYYDGTPAPYDERERGPGGWEDEGYAAGDIYSPSEYPPYSAEPAQQQYPFWNGGSHDPQPHSPLQSSAPPYIPPPDLPHESGLSEKERVRRAEQRLLPSQPSAPGPATALGGSSRSIRNDGAGPSAAAPSAPSPLVPEASAPTLDDLAASASVPNASGADDKQELERQRLLAEASAPPQFPEDYDADAAAAGPSAPPHSVLPSTMAEAEAEPSAPILTEEDEYRHRFAYGHEADASGLAATAPSEPLPAYQR
ncbi:unnamed protein product [Discula destructiva]